MVITWAVSSTKMRRSKVKEDRHFLSRSTTHRSQLSRVQTKTERNCKVVPGALLAMTLKKSNGNANRILLSGGNYAFSRMMGSTFHRCFSKFYILWKTIQPDVTLAVNSLHCIEWEILSLNQIRAWWSCHLIRIIWIQFASCQLVLRDFQS